MILLAYGTRPEYIKIKPVVDALSAAGILHKVLYTGQHTDIAAADSDVTLMIHGAGNRLDGILSSICSDDINAVFTGSDKPDIVVVQGDTTSAMAVAISAFHHRIPVAHLEAGLRTYDNDNPYPEEVNRKIISQIALIHLCPTSEACENLIVEGNRSKFLFVTGNTGLDNLKPYLNKVAYSDKVLVTLHRRENLPSMRLWFEAVESLAERYPKYRFILPLHPNPEVRKNADVFNRVQVIDPLDYSSMLDELASCRMVITDSGGLQEESSFLHKKCLVCRRVTERQEAVGSTTFMVGVPSRLEEVFSEHEGNPVPRHTSCPFGDGESSTRVKDILEKFIKKPV